MGKFLRDKIRSRYYRHAMKALTWRIISITMTVLIAWTVTEDMWVGVTIGSLNAIINTTLYYFHEHVWYDLKQKVQTNR